MFVGSLMAAHSTLQLLLGVGGGWVSPSCRRCGPCVPCFPDGAGSLSHSSCHCRLTAPLMFVVCTQSSLFFLFLPWLDANTLAR